MRLLNLLRNSSRAPKLRVEANADEATIYLYDAIGGWYGILAADFVRELEAITASTIHLRINSPGGDVFEARAIATAVRQKAATAKIIAHIDGLAASAATYVALAAGEVEAAKGSFFMIHNAWTLAMGNAAELRDTATLLDKVDGSIADDYAAKTGKDRGQIDAWMAAETWFTAEEALAEGFVDRIESEEMEDAEASAQAFNLAGFKNAPRALTEQPARNFDRETMERRLAMLQRIAP